MKIQEFTDRILGAKDKLYRFALRITGQRAEAEDVVQEVMLRIWDKKEERDRFQNLEAFLMRMVRNISLDKKRSKHYGHLEIEHINHLSGGNSPVSLAENRDTLSHVQEIIDSLSKKQQMILQLREIEGMSYQEIADVMEISLAQVKVNLFRARNQIREQLLVIEQYGLSNN